MNAPTSHLWTMSETRRQLGVTEAELCILLAILSHERVYGHSPTRIAIKAFLGTNINGYRLIREGWIESRLTWTIDGDRLAYWTATDTAKRALGFDVMELERKTA